MFALVKFSFIIYFPNFKVSGFRVRRAQNQSIRVHENYNERHLKFDRIFLNNIYIGS